MSHARRAASSAFVEADGDAKRRLSIRLALQVLAVPLVLGSMAWRLQHSALDVGISRLFFDETRGVFVAQSWELLEILGHQALIGLPLFVGGGALALFAGSFFVAKLAPWRALSGAVAVGTALGPAAVSWLKHHTAAHCPSVVDVFGGFVRYDADVGGSFWAARHAAGRCLPSGHAAGGFSMLTLYFAGALAGSDRQRRCGLAIGIVAGLVSGAVRVAQGAHFASQVMWSATVCWAVAAVVFAPLQWANRGSPARLPEAP